MLIETFWKVFRGLLLPTCTDGDFIFISLGTDDAFLEGRIENQPGGNVYILCNGFNSCKYPLAMITKFDTNHFSIFKVITQRSGHQNLDGKTFAYFF